MYGENNYGDYNNGNFNNYYYEENQESNDTSNNNNKISLIIKILIIIVCIAVIIWLVVKLKNNNNVTYNDVNVYASNIEKVRIASEKYFFLDDNLPKTNDQKMVKLATLIKKGYVGDVVDANQKVCNDLKSMITLRDDGTRYVLVIKLSCSTDDPEKIFYYDLKNFTCLNCNGATMMDGKNTSYADEKTEKEKSNYSCNLWSDWSFDKENDPNLEEKSRVVVLGVKKASNTCEVWSDYTTSSVNVGVNGLSESIDEVVTTWSDNKTSKTPVSDSATIKVVSVNNVGAKSYTSCPEGYTAYSDSQCISKTIKTADLTYQQYVRGGYNIINAPCNAIDTEKGSDGKYNIIYKGCQFRDLVSSITKTEGGYTEYVYQEKITSTVKKYRYCTKLAANGAKDEFTKEYYEEEFLPQGYEKVPGSEKTQYSYRLKVCEK